ncbi:MAG: peptidoglycan-binding domain-containing protein [Verrucomicrobiota bacterium]
MFRNDAGFDENNQGTRFDLILLSAMELAAIAQALESGSAGALAALTGLRHGSKGDLVEALQTALNTGVDGDFGRETKEALAHAQQAAMNGKATGIYSRDMDAILGFDIFS